MGRPPPPPFSISRGRMGSLFSPEFHHRPLPSGRSSILNQDSLLPSFVWLLSVAHLGFNKVHFPFSRHLESYRRSSEMKSGGKHHGAASSTAVSHRISINSGSHNMELCLNISNTLNPPTAPQRPPNGPPNQGIIQCASMMKRPDHRPRSNQKRWKLPSNSTAVTSKLILFDRSIDFQQSSFETIGN